MYTDLMQELALGIPTQQSEIDLPFADDIRIGDTGPVMRASGWRGGGAGLLPRRLVLAGASGVLFTRGFTTARAYTCRDAINARDGKYIQTAGMVLVRQKPGSANGVMFITIEDETGCCNVVVWAKTYEIYRRVILSSGLLHVTGQIQREGEVVHPITRSLEHISIRLHHSQRL